MEERIRSADWAFELERAIAHYGSYNAVLVALTLSVVTDIASMVCPFHLSGVVQDC